MTNAPSEPKRRWGASRQAWAHFEKLAKVDLLPVVSNPHLPLSPKSRMTAVGKTPSVFNHRGEVIGFTDWTDHHTNDHNIEAWRGQPDFGICIQTRRVRAFDCDVPDKKLSAKIVGRFVEELGVDLPVRFRKGTGKQLLAFVLEGDFSKRSFVVKEWIDEETGKTKRWIVEFLGQGQQFVAVGTHPEGMPYEWMDGWPDEFPTISAKAFERAWQAVVDEFALEGTDRRSDRRDPTLIEDLDVVDPVAEHLIESDWPTYGIERGKLYCDCPGKHLHSADNGPSETAWLLAGTGKYRNGHFSCRHESCKDEFGTDAAFLQAVGYRPAKVEEFEDLTLDDAVAAYEAMAPKPVTASKDLVPWATLPLPGFNRDNAGRIHTTLENITRGLRAAHACGVDIAFDTFRGELIIAEVPGQWRPFVDADAVDLRMALERLPPLGFRERIGKEMMRDALEVIGREKQIDTAIEWLVKEVPAWDGVARIHRFWPDYMKTKDTAYTRALGDYSWTAQAARILDPGAKVDMVPVLVGDEGTRKSTAISLIPPHEEFFSEFNLQLDDEKLARLMRGCLVGELAELRGISVRDAESVLAWITRRHEKWVPKFKEYATALARRVVFYGTTNDVEFLKPHMGWRRWLPVVIQEVIDTDAIARDRLQLWAEARDVYQFEGICFEQVEELAKAERAAFRDIDPWHAKVERWLDELIGEDGDGTEITPRNSGTLTAEVVLTDCLGFDPARTGKREQQRVAEVLKACGMARDQVKVKGKARRVWVANTAMTGGDRRTREGRS